MIYTRDLWRHVAFEFFINRLEYERQLIGMWIEPDLFIIPMLFYNREITFINRIKRGNFRGHNRF